MRFIDALIDSFILLKKEPKLFIPKIFIAAFYGTLMLCLMSIFTPFLELLSTADIMEAALYAREIFSSLLVLFIISIFAIVVDVFVNAMYPKMVEDFYNKKRISFKEAAKSALGRSFTVMPSVFIALIIYLVVSLPFILYMTVALMANDVFGIMLSLVFLLIVEFAVTFIFYLLYPVSMLEKQGVFGTLGKSFFLGKKHFGNVSKATVLQMFLSLASLVLAAVAGDPAFFVLFIISRFLTALIATYIFVLNPVVYLGIKSEKNVRT